MEEIPYPTLTLVPWSDTDPSILVSTTKRGFCTKRMQDDLISRAMEYKKEFDSEFPTGSKVLYFVPKDSVKDAFEKHDLKLTDFSALFLPSLSLIKRVNLPKEIKNGVVIAKDEVFSYFVKDQYILAIDLSGQRKNFVFIEKPNDFPFQEKFFLAEKA